MVEDDVAQVVLVDALAVEDFAHRIARRPQPAIVLEQAADHDDQREGEEQVGELTAARLGHREEQPIADHERVGQLDQPIGAASEKSNVGRAEDGYDKEKQDAEKADELSGLHAVPPAPQEQQPGNARRGRGERHLGGNLDRIVGVEADQEQADQRDVQRVEAVGRWCGCRRVEPLGIERS